MRETAVTRRLLPILHKRTEPCTITVTKKLSHSVLASSILIFVTICTAKLLVFALLFDIDEHL